MGKNFLMTLEPLRSEKLQRYYVEIWEVRPFSNLPVFIS